MGVELVRIIKLIQTWKSKKLAKRYLRIFLESPQKYWDNNHSVKRVKAKYEQIARAL